MNEKIVIDIDNLRARKIIKNQNNHFFIKDYGKQIKKLIRSRIKELDDNQKYQEYFNYIMHDSILIYGTRGNGKTTIMMNLKEILQDKEEDKENDRDNLIKNIRILEIIDPTLLEEDEDFLLIILKSLYSEIFYHHDINKFDNFDNNKKDFEKQLGQILEQIEGTRVNRREIEIFDKFYNNKSGVSLAKAIHKLFYTATKIFNVKTIILPIDDIDMNMIQGYKISETIRKYLASPYVIPIVSFNLKQMNAIARKNKYEAFGLDLINTDIEKYKDLDFLLSLPSDYLTAVFPPNRRIFLKSIYDILKQEKEKNNKICLKSERLQLQLKEFSTDGNIDLYLILSLFIEIIYEKRLAKNLVGKQLDDYLSNRSIRDFFHDLSALLNSLYISKDDSLKSKQSIMLARFSPENQNLFINKEQALTSLWYDFLDMAKKNITKEDLNKSDIKNNWTDIITNINYDDYAELVNKKTYRRLWLQRFYYKKTISIKKTLEEDFIVKKEVSISGFLELCLRSYIPMFLFQEIITRHKIEYSIHDIMKLKEMATADLMDVAYHISVMELFLKQHEYKNQDLRKNAKLFGSININYQKKELYESEYNIPFLFRLRKQDLFFDDNNKDSKQIYFFSIFKAIALFIVSLKIIENQKNKGINIFDKDKLNANVQYKFKKLFEQFRINLPCENKNNFVEKFLKKLIEDGYIKHLYELRMLSLEHSEFGIMECIKFSKRLIKFFYDIRANINLEDNFSSLNFNTNSWKWNQKKYIYQISDKAFSEKQMNMVSGEGTLSNYFKFPLSTYFSGFSQSLLISLISTQENIKKLDIYTINSIHGANITLLKEKKLAKESNAFISNINYLLSYIEDKEIKEKFKQLSELNDKVKYTTMEGIESKKIEEILSFYEKLLDIDYFKILIKNYTEVEPTEDCSFKKKQKCL